MSPQSNATASSSVAEDPVARDLDAADLDAADRLTADPGPGDPGDEVSDRVGSRARTSALPIELQLGGRHADAVRRWVEGTLGWQPVDRATARLVPPVVVLRDLDGVPAAGEQVSVPVLLLVDDDADAGRVAQVAVEVAPDAVAMWPSERAALVSHVDVLLGRSRPHGVGGRTLRVGGAAGGVGTTTIAYALAGLAAWHGGKTLLAVRGAGLPPRPMTTAALAAADIFARADEVPGVPGCRAVQLIDDDLLPDPTDLAVRTAVVDLGVAGDVDVLVCRPDRAALVAIESTTAAGIVVMGSGPVPTRAMVRAAGGRRVLSMPWSARVARAGLLGRLPAALPGAWLRRLMPLAPRADADARTT